MKGIDLSKYQRNVNYSILKEQGIEFAIIRCGFGRDNSQKDPLFEEHYEGCKNAGLKVGCYLYSYADNIEDGINEARNCLEFINGKEFDLPIYYDVEDNITLPLGKIEITKIIRDFCEEIENNGYRAGIYASLYWFNNYIDLSQLENYSKWVAQWANICTANFSYDIWQYSDEGSVNGIYGDVDMNKLINTDIIQKTQYENNTPQFEIGKDYTLQVNLNVRTGAGTEYRIKNYDELTNDGKNHATNKIKATLRKGTIVTCQDVYYSDNDVWLKIPSGYVCAIYNGEEYIK